MSGESPLDDVDRSLEEDPVVFENDGKAVFCDPDNYNAWIISDSYVEDLETYD